MDWFGDSDCLNILIGNIQFYLRVRNLYQDFQIHSFVRNFLGFPYLWGLTRSRLVCGPKEIETVHTEVDTENK